MDCARLFSHCSSHTVGAAFQRDFIFQPDTGPILCFPELNENVAPENLLGETAELAFVAWHTGGGELGPTATLDAAAEFLIRRPAEIAREEGGGGPVEVYHYSQALRVKATNRVFRVASGRARL